MDANFKKCIKFIIDKIEGPVATNDPDDPGGFTIYGLASRYNPGISKDTTREQAEQIYRAKYWTAECRKAEWPLDLVFFDSNINPQNDPELSGSGNQELIGLCGPWEHADPFAYAFKFLVRRAGRYARRSSTKFVRGHVRRCERILDFIESNP